MNCTEVQNNFGNAVDGTLQPSFREEFFKHLSLCLGCRKEYELESVTKNAVRNNVKHLDTPASVRSSILMSLRESYSAVADGPSWFERLFGGRRLFPSLVTILAVVSLVYYLVPPAVPPENLSVHTASNDVIFQTLQNFARIRDGQMKPKTVACDPAIITTYFKKNGLQFAADAKILDNCDWYGASYSDFDGVQLAHVVYQIGDDMTYVYEVKKDEAMEGSTLSMPSAAKQSLKKTGWYTDPLHPDCNVVVWTANGTLCSATSTMKKDRLAAMLTSLEPSSNSNP